MRKYGKNINSEEAWDQMAKNYSDQLISPYHNHRLAVINSLIPEDLYRKGKKIFDFGCGDALHFVQFLKRGCLISGIDISAEMITFAKQRLSQMNLDQDLANIGGVADLASLESNSLDAILSFNVLAYLTNEEENVFYREAARLLRPGGYLIVTHSNELFDLYSMNQYTVDFLGRHLVSDESLRSSLSTLVTQVTESQSISTYNVRENPLAYKYKLQRYGFSETRQEFINLHVAPPPLLEKDKFYPDTLFWKEEEKWKLMFICSTYGSLSVRELLES